MPQTGWIKTTEIYFLSSRGWKPTIKVLTVFMAHIWPSFPCVFPLYSLCIHAQSSSPYKDTSHSGLEPTLKTPFNLIIPLKTISKYRHILKYWMWGLQLLSVVVGTGVSSQHKFLLCTIQSLVVMSSRNPSSWIFPSQAELRLLPRIPKAGYTLLGHIKGSVFFTRL